MSAPTQEVLLRAPKAGAQKQGKRQQVLGTAEQETAGGKQARWAKQGDKTGVKALGRGTDWTLPSSKWGWAS